MNILIGGDLVPCENNTDCFAKKDMAKVLGKELYDIWSDADFKFFNLECPITSYSNKISKFGPCLKCNPSAVAGIKELNPSCVFLSNNHILDYSTVGLKDTINTLNRNKISWIGVGKNEVSLKKSFVFEFGGKRIGIYNCCEHEFSIATKTTPGANPYDEFSIDQDLASLSSKVDYLITIYHGGSEHYRYPSPLLQKRCQKMVRYGSKLVICQHSHCIGCEEKYNGSTIVYGQGNFVFNRRQDEFWNYSLLINLVSNNGRINIKYIPICQTEYGTRLANQKETREILSDFQERTEAIKDYEFIEKKYKEFAKSKLPGYLLKTRKSPWLRIVRKVFPGVLTNDLFFRSDAILNSLECESHRELFAQGLKDVIINKWECCK